MEVELIKFILIKSFLSYADKRESAISTQELHFTPSYSKMIVVIIRLSYIMFVVYTPMPTERKAN